jgi:hypothetical protein
VVRDGTVDQPGQIEAFGPQLNLDPHDPGHVEQVVDDSGQVEDLPLHHLVALAQSRVRHAPQAQDVQSVPQGG